MGEVCFVWSVKIVTTNYRNTAYLVLNILAAFPQINLCKHKTQVRVHTRIWKYACFTMPAYHVWKHLPRNFNCNQNSSIIYDKLDRACNFCHIFCMFKEALLSYRCNVCIGIEKSLIIGILINEKSFDIINATNQN